MRLAPSPVTSFPFPDLSFQNLKAVLVSVTRVPAALIKTLRSEPSNQRVGTGAPPPTITRFPPNMGNAPSSIKNGNLEPISTCAVDAMAADAMALDACAADATAADARAADATAADGIIADACAADAAAADACPADA